LKFWLASGVLLLVKLSLGWRALSVVFERAVKAKAPIRHKV